MRSTLYLLTLCLLEDGHCSNFVWLWLSPIRNQNVNRYIGWVTCEQTLSNSSNCITSCVDGEEKIHAVWECYCLLYRSSSAHCDFLIGQLRSCGTSGKHDFTNMDSVSPPSLRVEFICRVKFRTNVCNLQLLGGLCKWRSINVELSIKETRWNHGFSPKPWVYENLTESPKFS